jgi:peptidoglycan hydrolase-like protein with peptidoglycan-binding domain
MKKTGTSKKPVIIALVLVAVLVIAILIAAYMKKKKAAKEATANSNTLSSSGAVFPIKYGDQSEYVRTMQTWLVSQGASLPVYGIDGIFGDETKAALKVVTGKNEMDYESYSKIING